VLLRPILAFVIHNNLLSLAESYLSTLTTPLKSASLPCSLEISRFTNLKDLSEKSSPPELVEILLTAMKSKLTLYLPGDTSLSLRIQTPYQHPAVPYMWIAPFNLKACSPSSPDREISFDALSDAESLIVTAIDESLSLATSRILGPQWRKIELRRFENRERCLHVAIRRDSHDQAGTIVVNMGDGESPCINRSLSDELAKFSNT
jgi:hypothetical protein